MLLDEVLHLHINTIHTTLHIINGKTIQDIRTVVPSLALLLHFTHRETGIIAKKPQMTL
jgi:hypothetical protein